MSENVEEQQSEVKEIGQHLKNASIMPLFPTPLIIGEVEDETLCEELEEHILKLRNDKQGFFEAGNFVTDDQLYIPGRGFDRFSELVLNESKNFLDFLKVKRDEHYISGMWANVTNPNHRHPVHIHPNCLISGILYIKTPENCGKTAFSDPRPAARVFEPSYEEMFEFNSGLMRYPPKRGTMLMWPSWLPHAVERGFCADEDQERITIAFNVMMLGRIDTMTGKLELN